jgi:hypothetical protein
MRRPAVFLLLLALAMAPQDVRATTVPAEKIESLPVFCSLERPVIESGDSVKASVIADPANRVGVDYQWRVDEGAFLTADGKPSSQTSGGAAVEWSAKGASAGLHTLSLTAHTREGASGSCTLHVAVSAAERGVAPATSIQDLARAFLARDRVEDRGYGLYSYLILPDGCVATQSGALRQRCAVFLQSALVTIQQEKDMKAADVRPPAHLNLTYLLVTQPIPSDLATDLDRSLDQQVRWILDNYDYPRCHKLLLLLGHAVTSRGPIVISTKNAVFDTRANAADGEPLKAPEQLYQDYSDVPLNIMPIWLERFRNQSFQAQFWEPDALDSVFWDLRKYLAIAGLGLPAAEAAVKYIGDQKP